MLKQTLVRLPVNLGLFQMTDKLNEFHSEMKGRLVDFIVKIFYNTENNRRRLERYTISVDNECPMSASTMWQ